MEPAKVYFSDLRTDEVSTLEKLHRLMKAAGFEQIDFKDKYVAIKLHFGEPGNMAYLRPNWARVVCDYVRKLGGKPFLTDCNTLYVGGRANALDHLDSAMRNGYTPMTTGAQCIIADGLKGDDYDLVPIRGGKYLRAAKIGRAIMDADIFISLTHAKGHVSAGFGGALKNIGMGRARRSWAAARAPARRRCTAPASPSSIRISASVAASAWKTVRTTARTSKTASVPF